MTGAEPDQHGIHSEWLWHPEAMTVRRYTGRGVRPFWQRVAAEGIKVGLLDVPFAPFLGISEGFEICEWGAHDRLEGRMRVAPPTLASTLPAHPFAANRSDAAACMEGAKLRGGVATRLLRETRPELAVIVFTEVHRAAHALWGQPSLVQVMREVDEQIATIVAASDAGAVIIFSLHGMRPSRGLTTLLDRLLIETGFARLSTYRTQSWRERSLTLFAAAKRRAPRALRALYRRAIPSSAAQLLAQPTMIPHYDWSLTRAFALPTDQHGWIRINLAGREAKGVVMPREYEQTCRELEVLLRELKNEHGQPLVENVIRTSANAEDAHTQRLPDLVVHWTDAAPATLPHGKVLTGQHAPEGFVIARGLDLATETVDAKDLHRLIVHSRAP